MKTLNVRVIVALVFVLANVNVYAGSLLKGIVKGAEAGESANLKAMTPTGISTFQEFKAALDGSPRGLWYTWAEKHLAFLTPKNDGVSGVIQKMEVNADGQIVRTAFKIPNAGTTPRTVDIVASQELHAGVQRTYRTMSGEIKVTQKYKVENVSGKTLRVQTEENIITDTMHASASMIDDNLVLNIKPAGRPEHMNYHLEFNVADHGIEGKVVNFSLKPNEDKLVVHVAEGSDIVEYTFSLSYKPGGEFGLTVVPTRIGFARMTAAQIKSLGLLAEMKVIPGRVAAAAPVRGMEVEGALQ